MDVLKKFVNMVLPEEEIEEEFEEEEKLAVERPKQQFAGKRVVNGTEPVYTGQVRSITSAPQLTVHTTKIPELNIRIFVPINFDNVSKIADNLKEKRAAVVNYESVEKAEQRRICDFLNGVSYALEGEVKRISDTMVLYVPHGVNVSEATPVKK